MATSYHIASLLEKMTSADKDFRFMATNDLMNELQKDAIKLDEDSERKVVRMLLRLLEDKNGEVQNLAVKCMGPLVNKVKEHHVEVIVDTLCANMVSDQEQLRDVSSIGLKTVIDQLPPSGTALTSNTCRRVAPKIVAAVQKTVDAAIQLEGLDILAELLSKYGALLTNFHQAVQETLIPLLGSSRLAVRKRAIAALAHLCQVCGHSHFNATCDALVRQLESLVASGDGSSSEGASTARTYVASLGAVCKASGGARFGAYLPRVVPLLARFGGDALVDDDELREHCLHCFESIVLKCPKEVTPHLPVILSLCSKHLCHDPNYHYDDTGSCDSNGFTEMEVDGTDGSDGEGFDEGDQQEYSDDDDMSWKVRRASAKCLEAALSTRRELLPLFYRETGPLLISRFKEREENVKADIFRAYICLLKHTKLVVPEPKSCDDPDGLLALLQGQVPKLARGVARQLRQKSLRTRQSCFALLTELLRVKPGCLGAEMLQFLVPGVQQAMTDKLTNGNTKIDALAFLGVAMATHSPQVLHPYIGILVPLIVQSVEDPFYKVTAEALLVVQQAVRALRPQDPSAPAVNWPPYVDQLYAAVHKKLKATDIDQEVKERAIACTGHLLATFGDYLQAEVPSCLLVLLDRLKNEVTRLTTVRALQTICLSPLTLNLQPIFSAAVAELSEFLRKNHRALRLCTLQLLTSFVQRYEGFLDENLVGKILHEAPGLVNESDLQIAQMAVKLLTDLLKARPHSFVPHQNVSVCLIPIFKLIQSPLLQGSSLNTVVTFLTSLVQAGLERPSFEELKDALVKAACDPVTSAVTAIHSQPQVPSSSSSGHLTSVQSSLNSRQAYQNAAKCLAALVGACPDRATKTVDEFLNNLRDNRNFDSTELFSLLVLGEIGREYPKALANRQAEVRIMRGFQYQNEEVKSAASHALGGLAVGDLEKYLPFVLNEIQSQPKRQYLLLHSLKEIISSESSTVEADSIASIFKPHIDEIWTVLINHAECPEEGVRNVVAECLGKLCLLEPTRLVHRLRDYLNPTNSALLRSTVITSLKFTIVDQTQPVDPILKECIGDFLQSIEDPDLNVRRVSLVTLNSAAHNKPSLIRDCLVKLLPGVYQETKVRKELIREVEMGPFKHTVDDGLDLRKSTFECMYTLLETCLERLDVFEFLNHVEDGLKDHYDIKVLTYLMLIRLANLCPTQVLQRLDRLIDPLKQTLVTKVKANAVKQEYEKQDELKRCALRSVIALQSIAEADRSAQMADLAQLIKSSPDLFQLYEGVQKDHTGRSHYEGSHAMDADP